MRLFGGVCGMYALQNVGNKQRDAKEAKRVRVRKQLRVGVASPSPYVKFPRVKQCAVQFFGVFSMRGSVRL